MWRDNKGRVKAWKLLSREIFFFFLLVQRNSNCGWWGNTHTRTNRGNRGELQLRRGKWQLTTWETQLARGSKHRVREVEMAKETMKKWGRRQAGCHGRALNAADEKISSYQGQVVKGEEKRGLKTLQVVNDLFGKEGWQKSDDVLSRQGGWGARRAYGKMVPM